jgi:hypothetical protein
MGSYDDFVSRVAGLMFGWRGRVRSAQNPYVNLCSFGGLREAVHSSLTVLCIATDFHHTSPHDMR